VIYSVDMVQSSYPAVQLSVYCRIWISGRQLTQQPSMLSVPTIQLTHYTVVVVVIYSVDVWVVSSGNAWEQRSQSYFDSGNGQRRSQERNSPLVVRCICTFVNTPRVTPNSQLTVLSIISLTLNCLILQSRDNLDTVAAFS